MKTSNPNANVESFLHLAYPRRLIGEWTYSWYDVARQQMLLFKDGSFFLWNALVSSEPKFYYKIGDKSVAMILAKVSVDFKLLVIQINTFLLIVVDTVTNKKWEIVIKAIDGNEILPFGLIWSEHGGNSQDLIIVTTKGIELYKISSNRGQCKLSRSITQRVNYFWFEPNFRMILIATATRQHKVWELNGYFLRYDLADIPRLELPPPDKMPTFSLSGINAEDIKLVTLYGSLFCAVHDSSNDMDMLVLYALTKTRVERAANLPLFVNSDVRLSVTDNLLCCHCLQSHMSFIFDIKLNSSEFLGDAVVHESLNNKQCCGACTMVMDKSYVVHLIGTESRKANNSAIINSSEMPSAISSKNDIDVSVTEWNDAVGISTTEDSVLYVSDILAENVLHEIIFDNDKSSPLDDIDIPTICHVKEPYCGLWQLISPDLVWDPSSRVLWKLKCQMTSVVASMHDPLRALDFLSRRGQDVEAPRPVYSIDKHDALSAKQLMLQIILNTLESTTSFISLDVLFERIVSLYATEYTRRSKAKIINETTIPEIQHSTPIQDDAKQIISEGDIEDNKNETRAKNKTWGLFSRRSKIAASANEEIESASSTSADDDRDGKVIDSSKGGPLRRGSTGFLTASWLKSHSQQKDGNAGVDDKQFFPQEIREVEPLEQSISLYKILPDFNVLGGSLKGARALSKSGKKRSNSLTGAHLPVNIKRNCDGVLLITQLDMLLFVWIPLLNKDDSSIANKEKFLWAFSSYIATLKKYDVHVEPSVALLHINWLTLCSRYGEVARLLQLQFYSDVAEVALAALELSDTLKVSQNSLCDKVSTIDISHVSTTLLQTGLDMLWRLKERATVVRWLLEHHYVLNAVVLCMKRKSKWRSGLTPVTIPGLEFYRAGILLLVESHKKSPSMSESDKVHLLYTIYKFLTLWDTSLIAVQKFSGKSRLASLINFPEGVFQDSNTAMFKEMFGYGF